MLTTLPRSNAVGNPLIPSADWVYSGLVRIEAGVAPWPLTAFIHGLKGFTLTRGLRHIAITDLSDRAHPCHGGAASAE